MINERGCGSSLELLLFWILLDNTCEIQGFINFSNIFYKQKN